MQTILAFTMVDAVFFLVAGVVGVWGGYTGHDGVWYGRSGAWAIIALWALLKLVKVL